MAVAATVAAVASASVSGASLVNDVTQQALIGGSRSVSIHLANLCKSKILINPQVYTDSGYCYDPPQPTVGKGVTEDCCFGNTNGAVRGALGVMTYDITESRKGKAVTRLAIMFSVPFDYNLYRNWFALGLFKPATECDDSLYRLMNGNEGPFAKAAASGSEIRYQGRGFTLIGTMCPASKAEIKVELWD